MEKFVRHSHFKLSTVALLVSSVLFFPAYAETSATAADTVQAEPVQLDEITVIAVDRKGDSVTGLGKVIKNTKKLNKEQVIGIRDLTRYNPGIYATEQGRGASSGFTIRGLDKNRVSIAVDGIPQIQSINGDFNMHLKINKNFYQGSGARNEVEFENISNVEITKGGSSSENGSGALGGSVNFSTKDVDDILLKGKSVGVSAKSTYSSKDSQFMKSVGTAFRHNGFEGLVQYTHRKGKEIKGHPKADSSREITRLGWYEKRYDTSATQTKLYPHPVYVDPAPNTDLYPPFYLKDCTQNCGPLYIVSGTSSLPPLTLKHRDYTPEEKAQVERMGHWKERVSAEDYTGADRGLPDPKKFETHSWIGRLGYHFNEDHYVGWLFEETKQHYGFRDMSEKSYLSPKEYDPTDSRYSGPGYYTKNPFEAVDIRGQWALGKFSDDDHRKQRHGLTYIFNGGAKWVDRFEVNLDWQKIQLNTDARTLRCSPYPTIDKNCHASEDKIGSSEGIYRASYVDKHQRLNLKYNKIFDIGFTEHSLQIGAGIDRAKSVHNKVDYDHYYIRKRNLASYETIDGVRYAIPLLPQEVFVDFCKPFKVGQFVNNEVRIAQPFCKNVAFKSENRSLSLRDNVRFNKYLDLGAGVRWDFDKLSGNQSFLMEQKYKNISWNVGAVVRPTDYVNFSYRASNGFRLPSTLEFFGPSALQGFPEDINRDLVPEKSINHEFGLTFEGDWGYLESSYYVSRYRDLISMSLSECKSKKDDCDQSYHNFSNMNIEGINIQGLINLNALWNKIPDGYSLSLAYGQSKAKKIERIGKRQGIILPLDGIQPPRTVVGLNYDAPSQKWGLSAILTHSREKRYDEILYTKYSPHKSGEFGSANYKTFDSGKHKGTKEPSKRWYTLDLIGYVNLPHNITLRTGIYNVLNRRYSNWESLRQSSYGALHRHNDVRAGTKNNNENTNVARYSAPGRNFTFSLEMKF